MSSESDVTQLLLRWSDGDERALEHLVPLVYEPLKQMAHARLRGERRGDTLNTTGLVHEAYLKLVDLDKMHWNGRTHFLAMASRVMRRLLVDHAHRRQAQKRGGSIRKVELDEEVLLISQAQADEFLALDDALRRFEIEYPRPAKALELHYFGGLTQTEVADVLGISQPTVMRDLRFARARLAQGLMSNTSL